MSRWWEILLNIFATSWLISAMRSSTTQQHLFSSIKDFVTEFPQTFVKMNMRIPGNCQILAGIHRSNGVSYSWRWLYHFPCNCQPTGPTACGNHAVAATSRGSTLWVQWTNDNMHDTSTERPYLHTCLTLYSKFWFFYFFSVVNPSLEIQLFSAD